MATKKLGVYVELDCLLDTRLATLYDIHPELVEKVLTEGYTTRTEDKFGLVTKETFTFFYEKRTKQILANALPTLCCRIVKEMCGKIEKQAKVSIEYGGAAIYVDTHPYKLTDAEAIFLIEKLVLFMGPTIDIQLIDYGPLELTPQFCKERLGAVIMYDCGKWLDTHTTNDNFRRCQIPDVSLYIPSIYFGRPPTESELQELSSININPFRAFEINSAGIINVNVIDTVAYCADPSLHSELKDVITQ